MKILEANFFLKKGLVYKNAYCNAYLKDVFKPDLSTD